MFCERLYQVEKKKKKMSTRRKKINSLDSTSRRKKSASCDGRMSSNACNEWLKS